MYLSSQPAHEEEFLIIHTYTQHSLQEQSDIDYLAQVYYVDQAGDRTTDLPITGRPALSPEPEFSQSSENVPQTGMWEKCVYMCVSCCSGQNLLSSASSWRSISMPSLTKN